MKKQFATLKRRGLSVFLALALCMSLVQVNAFAAGTGDETDLAGNSSDPSLKVELVVNDPGPNQAPAPNSDPDSTPDPAPTPDPNPVVEGDDEDDGSDSSQEISPQEPAEEPEEELEPGQVKVEETLDETKKTEIPEGYVDNGDGTYTKTETGEVIDIRQPNGLKVETQRKTDYEMKQEPVQDENGNLIGYKTTIYATDTQIEKDTKRGSYTSSPNIPNLERMGWTVELLTDEDGNEIGYTKHRVNAPDSTGMVKTEYQVINYAENKCETTNTLAYAPKKLSEKTVTVQQNEDGTITYQPSVSGDIDVDLNSLTPDINTNSGIYRPDSNQLWKPGSTTVTHVNADFVYRWEGAYGIHSAIPINPSGFNDSTAKLENLPFAGLFILVDNKGNKHYVYCADKSTPEDPNTHYDIENIEDYVVEDEELLKELEAQGQYVLSSEDAQKVQAIALNGYWGKTGDENQIGSLERVKAQLLASNSDLTQEDVNKMTPGMALAATQAAIWYYTNGDKGINKDDPFNSKFYGGLQYNKHPFTAEQEALAMAYYKYLVDEAVVSDEVKDQTTDLINEDDVKDVKIEVKDLTGETTVDAKKIYNSDVSFIMEVEPARMFSDDLKVTLVDPLDGVTLREFLLAGEDGNNEDGTAKAGYAKYDPATKTYTLENVKLANGSNVTLKLSGTQVVKQNAYLIVADAGPNASQTFVGVEEGTRTVDMELKLHFSITDKPDPDPDPTPTPTPDPDPDPEEPPVDVPDPDVPLVPGPDPEEPPVDIPEEDPPLVDIPEEEPPLVEVPDPDVPLAPRPSTPNQPVPGVDIPDEDVPLADVPNTGDVTGLWCALGLVACAGLAYFFLDEKKRQNNAK